MRLHSKLFSLASLFLLCSVPAYAVDAPTVSVSGQTLLWSSVDAITINVHRDDGSWLESIPGDVTSWDAPGEGGYFLVAADHGDWQNWGKSNLVFVDATDSQNSTSDVSDGSVFIDNYYAQVYSQTSAELFWEFPNSDVVGVEVLRNDGAFTNTTGRSLYLSDLQHSTTYTFILIPYDIDGNAGVEVSMELTTANWAGPGSSNPSTPMRHRSVDTPVNDVDSDLPITAASLPENISITVYSNTRAELFWQGTSDNRLINYTVFRNEREVGQTSGHSFYFDDLIPGSDYVFAVSSNGVQADAATTTLTTGGLSPELVLGKPAEDPGTFNFAGWDSILSGWHSSYPSDCRFALLLPEPGFDELTEPVCFSPAQRDLMGAGYARRSVNFIGPRWQFKLPGDNRTNHIEGLAWYNTDEFALIADVRTGFGETAYEISRFDLWGGFIGTLPILNSVLQSSTDTIRQINLDGADVLISLQKLTDAQATEVGSDTSYGFRVVGEYYDPVSNGDQTQLSGWNNAGAFVALVNPIDGSTLTQQLFPGRTAQSFSVSD